MELTDLKNKGLKKLQFQENVGEQKKGREKRRLFLKPRKFFLED